ncbi:MAG TPA: hypothetical protein VMD52_05825 [Patescibacteria group bacterium]|nr:hypothetical protein [Patescibacteria group bacterium]
MKKGAKLTCVPCGRQIVVTNAGVSGSTIWCCGKPMKPGKKASPARKKKAKSRKKK